MTTPKNGRSAKAGKTTHLTAKRSASSARATGTANVSAKSAAAFDATRLSFSNITGLTWPELVAKYKLPDTNDASLHVYLNLFYCPQCGGTPTRFSAAREVRCDGCNYMCCGLHGDDPLGSVLARSLYCQRNELPTFLY